MSALFNGLNIAFLGRQGTGKSLLQSIYAQYLSGLFHYPIYSNYKLLNSTLLTSWSELYQLRNCVIAFDEFWQEFDSRKPKDNVELSKWVNQTRKRGIIFLFTSQSFGQVDLRCRNSVHYVIQLQKKSEGVHRAGIFEQGYFTDGRIALFRGLERFYYIYDTRQVIELLEH